MFLEKWIQERIGAGRSIEDYQLHKLRETLDYAQRESPFYRDLFRTNGVDSGDLRSIEDLAAFPFTTPEHLRADAHRLLCISLSGVKRTFTLQTGGTTGTPKKVFFSQGDLDRITDYMGAAMKSVAVSGGITGNGFKVYTILPNGKPESQQKMLARGVGKVGGMPIAGSLALTSEEQATHVATSRPHILFGPTLRVYRITQEAKHSRDLGGLGIGILFVTSAYLPPAMRSRLEELWRAQVFAHWGMTEMGWAGGIECEAHSGFHFNEMDFFLELVDPETGRPSSGHEEGELVLTTLNREAMPLIRYRTGDLATLTTGDCACGARSLRRIGRVIKKRDSVVEIGEGDRIDPAMLDDVIYRLPDVTSYQSVLVREQGKERLLLEVELGGGSGNAADIVEAIAGIPVIRRNLDTGRMVEPEVTVVGRGELRRPGRAKRLIEDARSGEAAAPRASSPG